MEEGIWVARQLERDSTLLAQSLQTQAQSDRLCSPAETVSRLRPVLRDHGITRLADITGLDAIGIPVWSAIRPNARSIAVGQGKGIDADAAQASALMEAIEVATAEALTQPVRRTSLRRLAQAGEHAEPLEDLIARDREPLGEDEEIDWAAGCDIGEKRTVWVPADALSLDQTGGEGEKGRYWRSSDGLASGNLLMEAALHGVLERIERDAMALWRLRGPSVIARRRRRAADLADPVLDALVAKVEAAGLTPYLFDATSDIGVPVFFCVIAPGERRRGDDWKHFDLVAGSGCHPRPAWAATRALTEAVQSRLTIISGARDDIRPSTYEAPLAQGLMAYLDTQPQPHLYTDIPVLPREKLLDGVVDRLRGAGLHRVIIVPLSGPGQPFAVAKAIVPGLEHPAGARGIGQGGRALSMMLSPR